MQQAIAAYYAELEHYQGLDVTYETAVRSAMQTLLGEVGWTLVPEYRLPNGKRNIAFVSDGPFPKRSLWSRTAWGSKAGKSYGEKTNEEET